MPGFAQELERLLASSTLQQKGDLHGGVHADLRPGAAEQLKRAGRTQDSKPFAFVAMPFREELLDVYDYGILAATQKAGFLCERADQEHFTGDILSWVKRRIDACAIVVVDLSFMNPNVYLEVGYAWGRRKPTVLLIQDDKISRSMSAASAALNTNASKSWRSIYSVILRLLD